MRVGTQPEEQSNSRKVNIVGSSTTEDAAIKVVPYSSDWPQLFAAEAIVIQDALHRWLLADVEHVGSTAVMGLSAKPIIDMMAPVRDLESSMEAIAAAESVGYCYYPYKPDQMHWFCKPSPAVRTHHLHLIPWRSQLWHERLAFRDALRQSPSLAKQYETLKVGLAAAHPFDRDGYTEAKSPFISSVLNAGPATVPDAVPQAQTWCSAVVAR